MIICGKYSCLETIRVNAKSIVEVLILRKNVKGYEGLIGNFKRKIVQPRELDRITGTSHHQGIALSVLDKHYIVPINDLLNREKPLIYLDGIHSPTNFGNIIRNCGAFGFNIVFPESHSVDINGTVTRVASGGTEHVKFSIISKRDFSILLTKVHPIVFDEKANVFLHEYVAPTRQMLMLVFGGEFHGVSFSVLNQIDDKVKISTGKFSTLNVCNSVAIATHHIHGLLK